MDEALSAAVPLFGKSATEYILTQNYLISKQAQLQNSFELLSFMNINVYTEGQNISSLTRSCRWSINQPPLFLLSKNHKNKNKHPGGFIFLPDDQFGCSGQTTQN